MQKLLLDHNLSYRLVARLADVFSGSAHVSDFGLEAADDAVIHDFAKDEDFLIVTRDEDYSDLVTLRGYPPKVVWLRVGNCTTNEIERYLRSNQAEVEQLASDASIGILQITS